MKTIDRYYQKANQYIAQNQIEEALTTFISGVDKGCAKCAFGILQTTITYGSYTMTEDEAISIFQSCYDGIKRLAETGDDEAMFIVAQSIRYGFVEDGDEPYLFWLQKAADLGNEEALILMHELDSDLLPLQQPEESEDLPEFPVDLTRELLEQHLRLSLHEEPNEDPPLISQDKALIANPNIEILEQYGLVDKVRKKQNDLVKRSTIM